MTLRDLPTILPSGEFKGVDPSGLAAEGVAIESHPQPEARQTTTTTKTTRPRGSKSVVCDKVLRRGADHVAQWVKSVVRDKVLR